MQAPVWVRSMRLSRFALLSRLPRTDAMAKHIPPVEVPERRATKKARRTTDGYTCHLQKLRQSITPAN
eukprot:scaffold112917_cov22-Tisochrysis_lutea.AAC.2